MGQGGQVRGGVLGVVLEPGLRRAQSERVAPGVHVGEGPLAVDRSAIIGRNVMERDDLAYARMVRAHVLEACAEGTVYREMDIPMNGLRGRYRRVAAAGRRGPDGTRQVVTLVQIVGLTAYN